MSAGNTAGVRTARKANRRSAAATTVGRKGEGERGLNENTFTCFFLWDFAASITADATQSDVPEAFVIHSSGNL
ncbi:hypothetical protein SRHO_G00132580 [Serrasalmus rhombeus]